MSSERISRYAEKAKNDLTTTDILEKIESVFNTMGHKWFNNNKLETPSISRIKEFIISMVDEWEHYMNTTDEDTLEEESENNPQWFSEAGGLRLTYNYGILSLDFSLSLQDIIMDDEENDNEEVNTKQIDMEDRVSKIEEDISFIKNFLVKNGSR